MQLLHDQRQQTACGILQLDLTLTATVSHIMINWMHVKLKQFFSQIVGALTTYLVILIQFDANSRTFFANNCTK